jgi:hypothetical protein
MSKGGAKHQPSECRQNMNPVGAMKAGLQRGVAAAMFSQCLMSEPCVSVALALPN